MNEFFNSIIANTTLPCIESMLFFFLTFMYQTNDGYCFQSTVFMLVDHFSSFCPFTVFNVRDPYQSPAIYQFLCLAYGIHQTSQGDGHCHHLIDREPEEQGRHLPGYQVALELESSLMFMAPFFFPTPAFHT